MVAQSALVDIRYLIVGGLLVCPILLVLYSSSSNSQLFMILRCTRYVLNNALEKTLLAVYIAL